MNTLVLTLLQPVFIIFKLFGHRHTGYSFKLFALFLAVCSCTIVHVLLDDIWWTIVYEGSVILDVFPE
ncbi:MAG: hypothetical protein IPG02_00265 [Ignavibacteria bacterium]|nr:hypothetical protein [Ignavibacteria bacterium]MBK6877444.1 hypothetical protein [Ignavibacteria bacterium]MBK9226579.1 hypothetical protein [Ignavibacteria bacterium]